MSMEKKAFDTVRTRLAEVTVALLLFYLVVNSVAYVREYRRSAVPASAWFEVFELFVPDHEKGSNPLVIYDRTIHEAFRGFWIVEVQRRDSEELAWTECSGAGLNDYEPTDILPERGVTWEWFLGRPCTVGPGSYRLRVSYEMTKPNWPTKHMVVVSNTFRVTDPQP